MVSLPALRLDVQRTGGQAVKFTLKHNYSKKSLIVDRLEWIVGIPLLVVVLIFAVPQLLAAGGDAVTWLCPDSEWAYRLRYSLDSDFNGATFEVRSIPHDCEFLTAPIGGKYCHYNKRAVITRIRTNESGRRFYSLDDGKTWAEAAPDTTPTVFISWDKVND
jgi:hypothetical protein